MQQNDPITESWLEFLNPVTLREKLIRASMFLAAFEMLQNSVIDGVRRFFCHDFDDNLNLIDSVEYKTEVLGRHKSPFAASLDWLVENGAVDASDVERAQAIRDHRNVIGHELPEIIGSTKRELEPNLFDEILKLVGKIDRYWLREFEIPCNPDLDHLDPYEIDDSMLRSGRMVFLDQMMDIALGDKGDDLYNAARDALAMAGKTPPTA